VEHSKRFRGVAETVAALPFETLVLDGEVAIFDQQLRSRFDWLRGTPEALATPPIYIAFDVLYRSGKDETDRPLQDRRVLLEHALAGGARTCSQYDASPTTDWTPGPRS
jgi:ATP-dependent DNA ligase